MHTRQHVEAADDSDASFDPFDTAHATAVQDPDPYAVINSLLSKLDPEAQQRLGGQLALRLHLRADAGDDARVGRLAASTQSVRHADLPEQTVAQSQSAPAAAPAGVDAPPLNPGESEPWQAPAGPFAHIAQVNPAEAPAARLTVDSKENNQRGHVLACPSMQAPTIHQMPGLTMRQVPYSFQGNRGSRAHGAPQAQRAPATAAPESIPQARALPAAQTRPGWQHFALPIVEPSDAADNDTQELLELLIDNEACLTLAGIYWCPGGIWRVALPITRKSAVLLAPCFPDKRSAQRIWSKFCTSLLRMDIHAHVAARDPSFPAPHIAP